MSKAELVMLAHPINLDKQSVRGWFASEKLDGLRAWWDGGISRGLPASDVPYCYTGKHGRFLTPPKATGLWSRYGQPIQAPDWWLDEMPSFPLDGELYIGPGRFQDTTSICLTKNGDNGSDWTQINYMVFDRPGAVPLFGDREVTIDTRQKIKLKLVDCYDWAVTRARSLGLFDKWSQFGRPLAILNNPDVTVQIAFRGPIEWLPQIRLDVHNENEAKRQLDAMMTNVLAKGGEGIMLRAGSLRWHPERTRSLLKVKPALDAEATVVGYKFGEVGIGGKFLGKMGALTCRMDNGNVFDLSGFTDAQRELANGSEMCSASESAKEYASKHPGGTVPAQIYNPTFPRGSRITYKYRELTVDGLPKEARYYRKATTNVVS